jgi:hypothetical protein
MCPFHVLAAPLSGRGRENRLLKTSFLAPAKCLILFLPTSLDIVLCSTGCVCLLLLLRICLGVR